MKAIFEDRERQYTVKVGDKIAIDKIENAKADSEIVFDKLMMVIDDENKVNFGAPYLKGATVKAKVISNELRDPKIIVFKFKRRKSYKRTKGHKQPRTYIKIEGIQV